MPSHCIPRGCCRLACRACSTHANTLTAGGECMRSGWPPAVCGPSMHADRRGNAPLCTPRLQGSLLHLPAILRSIRYSHSACMLFFCVTPVHPLSTQRSDEADCATCSKRDWRDHALPAGCSDGTQLHAQPTPDPFEEMQCTGEVEARGTVCRLQGQADQHTSGGRACAGKGSPWQKLKGKPQAIMQEIKCSMR